MEHYMPAYIHSTEPDSRNTVSADDVNISPNSPLEPRTLDYSVSPLANNRSCVHLNYPSYNTQHNTLQSLHSPTSPEQLITFYSLNQPLTIHSQIYNKYTNHTDIYNKEQYIHCNHNPKLSVTTHPHPHPFTVLVAEDSLPLSKLLRRLLYRLDYNYVICSDGIEVVEEYRKSPTLYNVCLMDLCMPRLDGYRATAAIRTIEKQRNDISHLPIIAYTSMDTDTDRLKAIEHGFDYYLIKPSTLYTLHYALQYAILNTNNNTNNNNTTTYKHHHRSHSHSHSKYHNNEHCHNTHTTSSTTTTHTTIAGVNTNTNNSIYNIEENQLYDTAEETT